MASQFLCSVKYGLLAIIAFVGPKVITDSGSYLSNVEKGLEHSSATKNEQEKFNFNLNQNTRMTSGYPLENFSEKEKINFPKYSSDKQKENFSGLIKRSNNQNNFFDNSLNIFSDKKGDEIPSFDNKDDNRNLWMVEKNWKIPFTAQETIFRFDRSPDWILKTWTRADTVHSEYPLLGYRVAVITGPDNDDLSGVLTYYFNRNRLARIDFSGQTGDYNKIQRYLTRVYGLKLSDQSPFNTYLYESSLNSTYFREETAQSSLRITATGTAYADKPKENYDIDIILFP